MSRFNSSFGNNRVLSLYASLLDHHLVDCTLDHLIQYVYRTPLEILILYAAIHVMTTCVCVCFMLKEPTVFVAHCTRHHVGSIRDGP